MTVQEQTLSGPLAEEVLDVKAERYYYATQRQLIWWRFRRHRLAMI